MKRGRVLFVDDEAQLRDSACEWLTVVGFDVTPAASAAAALRLYAADNFDALVTDVRMPGIDGLALLDRLLADDPHLPVVLLTGHGDVSLAVDAMRRGAHDFLEKPYDADHLVAVLDRAVRERRLGRELQRLREGGEANDALEARLVGNAPAVVDLRNRILQIADIDIDILIEGETGTGKEVVARALHDFGRRRQRPFVALNCAAIPESVFESELFGHERGAFTGAVQKRVGRIEHAEGGTIFLDEIESMPPALQAKLLRVIQERVIEPIGSNREVPLDIRFIAATKTDLKVESEQGRFRPDLYFRLATVTLPIPPLNERGDDIALLFHHFVTAAARRHGVADIPLPPSLLRRLGAAKWQGNVRELKSAAERHVLGLPTFRQETRAEDVEEKAESLPERLAAYEARLIRDALDAHDGNLQAASEALGVPRRTLAEKAARLGVRRAS